MQRDDNKIKHHLLLIEAETLVAATQIGTSSFDARMHYIRRQLAAIDALTPAVTPKLKSPELQVRERIIRNNERLFHWLGLTLGVGLRDEVVSTINDLIAAKIDEAKLQDEEHRKGQG